MDIVQRHTHAPVVEGLVEVAVVVGGFLVSPGHHQVFVGVDTSRTGLGVVCFQESLIGLGRLVGLTESLISHGTHNLDASLVFVEVFRPGIGPLTVHA